MSLSCRRCVSQWTRAKAHLSALIFVFGFLPACISPGSGKLEGSAPPERVVSLVPTVTETLFALGVGDRVVGVSDFDHYPPQAAERPRVGALVNPNVEKILELQPDLVFTYGSQSLLHERLAAANIEQYSVVSGNIEQILESIRGVSRAMGVEAEGSRLTNQIRTALDEIRTGGGEERPRVLLAHSRKSGTMGAFYTGGSESYFNELIDIAGGQNIFDDVEENVFQPSLEEVLERAPEVIIELLPEDRTGLASIDQRVADWQRLESIPAVRDRRVHVLTGDHLLLVGPRIHLAASDIAKAIRGDSLTVGTEK